MLAAAAAIRPPASCTVQNFKRTLLVWTLRYDYINSSLPQSPPNPRERERAVNMGSREKKKLPAETISLRRFDLSDVDDYMAWASDDKVSHFCQWDTFTSKGQLLKHLAETVIPHPWFRAICVDNRPVGSISVMRFSGSERCKARLSYAVAREQWGRGVATAGVKMAVQSVFREMDQELERVEAYADPENVASMRVLEKVGFQKEGLIRKFWINSHRGCTRDAFLYSFLSTDHVQC